MVKEQHERNGSKKDILHTLGKVHHAERMLMLLNISKSWFSIKDKRITVSSNLFVKVAIEQVEEETENHLLALMERPFTDFIELEDDLVEKYERVCRFIEAEKDAGVRTVFTHQHDILMEYYASVYSILMMYPAEEHISYFNELREQITTAEQAFSFDENGGGMALLQARLNRQRNRLEKLGIQLLPEEEEEVLEIHY